MIGIEVKFDNGYHGSRNSERDLHEWPPTADRFHQSLVASFYAMLGVEHTPGKERQALEWLENQPLPEIIFPDGHYGKLETYVPTHTLKKPYPDRQLRTMLTFQPRYPSIFYVWPDATINEHWGALGKVLAYYSFLGTARSTASAKLILELPELPSCYTRIAAHEDGNLNMPVYYPGRLDDLDWRHNEGGLVKRITARYGEVLPPSETHPGLFKSFYTYKLEGSFIRSIRAAEVASEVRTSLLKMMSEAGHELACIVGHETGVANHLAYLPLVYAGSEFSDGSIQGVGIGIPHDIDPGEEAVLGRLLNKLTDIKVRGAECSISRTTGTSVTLSTNRWSRPSYVWATVTPMEMRWATKKDDDQYGQIRKFCEWARLPVPTNIEMSPYPWFRGSELASKFVSPNVYKQRQSGFLSHVRLTFDVPVRGPVILGRGGNFGVGLFSQVWSERKAG